jgi:hypothetical protein
MVVVVMQPTYLPWIGYFDLIGQADIFVFLDTVQFEKQSWQQRNRIKTSQGVQWLSVPVFHSFGQKIIDVRINNQTKWRRKHWMSLFTNYGKAPFWSLYGPELDQLYQREYYRLAELNIDLVKLLCGMFGIKPRFLRTSEQPPLPGTKVEPLIALCKQLGADTYLSPAGSRAYLESETPFRESGISLVFQEYEHPIYPQLHGGFISHLSVVDLLMNTGPRAPEIILSGRKPWEKCSEMAMDNEVVIGNRF